MQRLEDEIAKAEDAKKVLENQMANPDVYSNGEKCKAVQKQIDDIDAKLTDLNAQWEAAAEKLSSFSVRNICKFE